MIERGLALQVGSWRTPEASCSPRIAFLVFLGPPFDS